MDDKDRNYLALLGTKGGPAIRPGSTNPTSNLLVLDGRPIVIDCGLGVSRGLVDQGIALKDISLIFITHLHSDHYLELGPLLHTAWTAGLATEVAVYGPVGLSDYWHRFLQSMKADIDLRIEDEGRPDLGSLVTLHDLDPGVVLESDALEMSAIRNLHPPLVETFALSFRSRHHHIVFSGDTAYMPALAEFAQGADVLVHEAMFEEALAALTARVGNGDDRLMTHLQRSHTKVEDAGRIAAKAGVKTLALNHLIPSDDPAYSEQDWRDAIAKVWDGTVVVGRDGLRIELR